MEKVENFLINCGLRNALSAFAAHNIKMNQITSLSRRELRLLFPRIGDQRTFAAATKRMRIEDKCKRRKRATDGWRIKDLSKVKKRRDKSNRVTKKMRRVVSPPACHSKRKVAQILKTDKIATSELLEMAESLLACHSEILKPQNRRYHFSERALIDLEKGKLNCPVCPSQVTPYLRKLSPITWKVANYKRHLEEFHADLKDSSVDEYITAMAEVVMGESSDDSDWSENENLPIKMWLFPDTQPSEVEPQFLELMSDAPSTIKPLSEVSLTNVEVLSQTQSDVMLSDETANCSIDELPALQSLPVQISNVQPPLDPLEQVSEEQLPASETSIVDETYGRFSKEHSSMEQLCDLSLSNAQLSTSLPPQTLPEMPNQYEQLPYQSKPQSLEPISLMESLPLLDVSLPTEEHLLNENLPNGHLSNEHLPEMPNSTNGILNKQCTQQSVLDTQLPYQSEPQSLEPIAPTESLPDLSLSNVKRTLPDLTLSKETTNETCAQSLLPVRTNLLLDVSLQNENLPNGHLSNEHLPNEYLPEKPITDETIGMFCEPCSLPSVPSFQPVAKEHLPLGQLSDLSLSNAQMLTQTLPEMQLNEYTDDGHRCFSTLMRGDLQVHLGDTVYILRDIDIPDNSAFGSTPRKHTYKTIGQIDYADCDIFRVEELWKDDEGNRFVFGHHYLRPHETFHKANKKFYRNELIRVPVYEKLSIDLIMGQCWVLDRNTFCKGRPIHCDESHVYICELKVDKSRRIFSKISRQEYPVCTKSCSFQHFQESIKISRNYSPNHDNKKKQ